MGQLEDMEMFVRIVEAGGIGRASEQLNLAKSAVSRRLADLENRLGTQLLNRTTRKSSLTESGTEYYRAALSVLDQVSAVNSGIGRSEVSLKGVLKITAPLSFGLLHLGPVIDGFAKQHSALKIQIDFSDRQMDLVEEGYEMAIRIANLKDSGLRAKRITTIRLVLVASPDYLKESGTPECPEDLSAHRFLQYNLNHEGSLKIEDDRGRQTALPVRANMESNNGDFLREMAVKGQGIACLPTFLVYREILKKELCVLLPNIRLPTLHAHAVYPGTRFLSRKVRLLIDFISECFGQEPHWDRELRQNLPNVDFPWER